MKLYTYPAAPSPQRVHILLREKGIEIPCEEIDLRAKEQLSAEYRAINPRCTVPALVLDDGTMICEVVAICHYLEALYPQVPLLGKNPRQKALISEWNHRVEMECLLPIADALRNKGEAFKGRALPGALDLEQIPELVPRGIKRIEAFQKVLDQQLSNNAFVTGEEFSMADISAFVGVNFARWVKVYVPDELFNLQRWHNEIAVRPSLEEAD